ncbi:hypothetical protein ACFW2Y_13265 [Streptomyces sp. NPDC058877]|uniref:hypothetical protein n=1 Tax=Streptomyces sp. NPDC058877 TaxID=3346665 RepID=UPI00368F7ECA
MSHASRSSVRTGAAGTPTPNGGPVPTVRRSARGVPGAFARGVPGTCVHAPGRPRASPDPYLLDVGVADDIVVLPERFRGTLVTLAPVAGSTSCGDRRAAPGTPSG